MAKCSLDALSRLANEEKHLSTANDVRNKSKNIRLTKTKTLPAHRFAFILIEIKFVFCYQLLMIGDLQCRASERRIAGNSRPPD